MTVIVGTHRAPESGLPGTSAQDRHRRVFAIVDADDVIGPGYVSALASALDAADFVAARMDSDELNQGWRRHARALPQTDGLPGNAIPWAYGGTLGMRRSTFERVGGFAEDFAAEDVDSIGPQARWASPSG